MYMMPYLSLVQNQIVLPASGIINALIQKPIPIHVSKFSKIPPKWLNGVLTGVQTNLHKLIVHPDQAAIMLPSSREKRRQEDNSVANRAAAVQYKEKKLQYGQMDKHEKFETVDGNSFDKECRKTSILVLTMPKNVRKVRTRLPSFGKCGTEVRAELK